MNIENRKRNVFRERDGYVFYYIFRKKDNYEISDLYIIYIFDGKIWGNSGMMQNILPRSIQSCQETKFREKITST